MTFIEWQTIRVATGKALLLNGMMLGLLILIFLGTLGYYFWQAYRNR